MRGGAPQAHDSLVAKSIFTLRISRMQAQNEHHFLTSLSVSEMVKSQGGLH
jgi:hypothetical protein